MMNSNPSGSYCPMCMMTWLRIGSRATNAQTGQNGYRGNGRDGASVGHHGCRRRRVECVGTRGTGPKEERRRFSKLFAELTRSQPLLYALLVAEAVRQIHDTGQVHGGISPATIGYLRAGEEPICVEPCL
jgi:hypothetical protein